jgi:hypothetical protein
MSARDSKELYELGYQCWVAVSATARKWLAPVTELEPH